MSLATVALDPGQVDTNPVYNAVDSDVVTGAASAGPLGLAIASYNGDGVTTTPSEAALAGTDVTYQVTVSNVTTSTQTNVSVPVTLAPNFTLDSSVTTSDGTTTTAAGVVTWSIPSLGAGASATLSYTESTDGPSAVESDTTSASATSDQSTTPSTTSAAVEVIPAADLTITVTDGVDTIAPGAADTYTITLTNHGPSAVTNAAVADTLNGGFTPLSATSSVDGTNLAELGAGQFEWTGVNLASGASATFTLMGMLSSTLASGSAFVDIAGVSLPPGQVDTDVAANAVDSDTVIAIPQAITFTPPTLGIAGQSATLSATGGGSGNPVVFSVDPASGAGVCSVTGTDGTTLDYAQAGTCVIDANQAGNASYAAAPTLMASITVEQMPAFTARHAAHDCEGGAGLHVHLRSQRRAHPDVCTRPGRAGVAVDRSDDRRAVGNTPDRHRLVHVLGRRRQRRREGHRWSVCGLGGDELAGGRHLGRPLVPGDGPGGNGGHLHADGGQCRPRHGALRQGRPRAAPPVLAGLRHRRRLVVRRRRLVVRARGPVVRGLSGARFLGQLHRQLPAGPAGRWDRPGRGVVAEPRSQLRQQPGGGEGRRDRRRITGASSGQSGGRRPS